MNPTNVNISAGAHLFTSRGLYTHHGIYIGGGQVIHYSGLANGLGSNHTGTVCQVSLEEFENGNGSTIQHYMPSEKLPAQTIVERAKSRLGESQYNVIFNNCEHFAQWCVTGNHDSQQINRLVEAVLPDYADDINQVLNFLGKLSIEMNKGKIANESFSEITK